MGWLHRLAYLTAALIACVTMPVLAQDLVFRTPDQFRTEILRLDELIERSERSVAAAGLRLQRATADATRLTDAFAQLTDAISVLQAAVTRKLQAGDFAFEEKTRLDRLLARIGDVAAQGRAAIAREEQAAAGHRHFESKLEAAATRRQLLLARHRASLDPVYLDRVRLSFTDPRDRITTELYSAEWGAEYEDNSELLAQMAEELETVDGIVAALEENYRTAEQRFKAVSRHWQAVNDAYYIQVAYMVPLTNILLEAGDVSISVAMSGPGWPAALLFELGYRTAESVDKYDDVRTMLPKLPDEILAARERLAASDLPRLAVPQLAMAPNPDGSFGTALRNDVTSELLKGAAALGYAGLSEKIAQHAVAFYRAGLESGRPASWTSLALGRVEAGDGAMALYARLGGMTRQESARMTEMLLRSTSTRVVDGALSYLRQPSFWKDYAKGLGTGLVVTAAKAGVQELNRQESAELFERLATIELEWFVRRRAYQTANYMLGFHREVRNGLVRAMQPELQRRDAAARQRHLTRQTARRIVLSDWQWQQGPMLELSFSDRMIRSGFDFGDGKRRPTTGSYDRHTVRLGPDSQRVLDGPATLRVFTDADGPWGLHDGFDADPRTIPLLQPDRSWNNREPGPDTTHVMTFALPELRLLQGDTDSITEGDEIELHYRATSTSTDGAWIGIVDPVIIPVEMPAHISNPTFLARGDTVPVPPDANGSEGTVRLTAPGGGKYEVRLYDRNRLGIAVARLPICITHKDPEMMFLDDCGSIEGHWLWKWEYQAVPVRREILPTGSSPNSSRVKSYEIYAPTRRAQTGEPPTLCTRTGDTLSCRQRLDPAENCTALEPGWEVFQMQIDASGNRITGVYTPRLVQDVSDCRFEPKPALPGFPFELTRNPDPPPGQ